MYDPANQRHFTGQFFAMSNGLDDNYVCDIPRIPGLNCAVKLIAEHEFTTWALVYENLDPEDVPASQADTNFFSDTRKPKDFTSLKLAGSGSDDFGTQLTFEPSS